MRNGGLPSAVVIGLDCITGLQTARILAGHGVPVHGIAHSRGHHCTRTRTVQSVTWAATRGDELIEALVREAPRFGSPAVLVPCTDASVLTLSSQRDRVPSSYRVVLPEASVVEMLMNKRSFHRFAEHIGLPLPAARLLTERADAVRAAETLRFPCILKPSLKSPEWDAGSPAKVHRAHTPDELLTLYDRYAPFADSLLVQQWIPGPDSELYSCNCYFDRHSQPQATFVARKLRQWPPRTGTSCLGEECRNETVRELTVRAFSAAGFCGLGYLEVKRDFRTGEHYVIEANVGRPTGRSAIAEAGGVDLLFTAYSDAAGLPLPLRRVQQFRGARWIYWKQDARSAWYYWRRGELSLGDWISSWRGRKMSAVWSRSDPLPALAGLLDDARTLLGRAPRRRTPAAVPRTGGVRPVSVPGEPAAPGCTYAVEQSR